MSKLRLMAVGLAATAASVAAATSAVGQEAPTFAPAAQLEGVRGGQAAWGDYDSDGDLDLVVVGQSTMTTTGRRAVLFRNEGGRLTDSGVSLVQVSDFAAWGDYDGDGDLDLVIGGSTGDGSVSATQLYANHGGVLAPVASSLAAFQDGAAAAWGDYDNDGDLDLVLAGLDGSTHATRLYRNDHGTFTDALMDLAPDARASLAWADYDADGDLDLLVAGEISVKPMLYRNDSGRLVDSGAVLPQCWRGSMSWADYDGDGDLDLALAGSSCVGATTRILRNDGGQLLDSGIDLGAQYHFGSVSWGDPDGDGDPDLLVTGNASDGGPTRLYRNDGGGKFTEANAGLPALEDSGVAWGDFDGDGGTDVVAFGYSSDALSLVTTVYRNVTGVASVQPASPVALGAITLPEAGSVLLAWSPASDPATPKAALSFNVRVGTTPGGSEVMSAMANPVTGYRRVVENGNAGQVTRFPLRGLPTGVYYWSVQALDARHAGSAFSPEQSFTIGDGGGGADFPVVVTKLGSGAGTVNSMPPGIDCGSTCTTWFPSSYTIELVATPAPGSTFAGWGGACSGIGPCFVDATITSGVTATFESPSYSVDVTVAGAGTVFSSPGGIYCGGDCGESFTFGTGVVLVARPAPGFAFAGWTGACTGAVPQCLITVDSPKAVGALFVVPAFTLAESLTGIDNGGATWGDYDGDGRLDLAVVGMTESAAATLTRVYHNSDGHLVDSGATLLDVESLAKWADYDNDGDLDLLVGGWSPSPDKGHFLRLYGNDAGSFVSVNVGLPTTVGGPTAAWGDFDRDGDLDLAIAGVFDNAWQAHLYRNDHGFFVEDHALPRTNGKSVAWGDYDRDGDLDLLVAGDYQKSHVYRNDGGTFTDLGAGLLAVDYGAADWVDFNGDGWLDIAVSGLPWGGAVTTRLYENDASGSFREFASPLPGDYKPPSWADYDNDGHLDALVCANDGTYLFRNDYGTFTDTAAGLPQVWNGRCGWGDLDSDGQLEVVISGYSVERGQRIAEVYRGSVATANTPPGPPSEPRASAAEGSVSLHWGPSSDLETPPTALTYNVRVGTTPAGNQILSAMSDGATGLRRIVASGNAGSETALTLRGLPPGQYYFAVQTVDGGFAGSAFSEVVPFVVTAPQLLTVAKQGTGTGTVTSAPAGIDCGPSCAATFASGTAVALTALPGAGSAFRGWSGACTGTAQCTVAMDAPRVVVAMFDDIVHADLSLSLTDGQTTALAGQYLTYTLRASNAGPNPATGAVVSAALPRVLKAVRWTCAASGGARCTTSGTGDIAQPVDLPVGGAAVFTVSGLLSAGASGSLVATASVSEPSPLIDPVLTNNVAGDQDAVTPLEVSIADASVREGDKGTTDAPVTVTLSHAAADRVFVDFTTADGTAVAPSDYWAQTGRLSFSPGVLAQIIKVRVVGDKKKEQDERFAVVLTCGDGTISRSTGVVTIQNDDPN